MLATHTFSKVYVGCDANLYPSPDRRNAVLVMSLDTGWMTDAAIYPVAIPAQATARWRSLSAGGASKKTTPRPR